MVFVLTDPLVQSYIFYSSVLVIKLLLMGPLTAIQRVKKGVFANEEDAKAGKGVVKFNDPDVERVRRAHLNDLENIPVFWVVGALYLTTGPSSWVATLLFRLYTAARIVFTYVYAIKPLPQPARTIAFEVSSLITLYMGGAVAYHYISAI